MTGVSSVFQLAQAQHKIKKHFSEFNPAEFLQIEHEKKVERRKRPPSKYDAVFSKLKMGSCLICEFDEVKKTEDALRKWLNRNDKPGRVYRNAKCKDGLSRIWWLEK